MKRHRPTVGIIHVVLGLLSLVPAIILSIIFGGITGIVSLGTQGDAATTVVGLSLVAILAFVVGTTVFGGVLGIVGGAAVLKGRRWGDWLVAVASALYVFNVPIGTAIGVYSLYVLFAREPFARGGVQQIRPS